MNESWLAHGRRSLGEINHVSTEANDVLCSEKWLFPHLKATKWRLGAVTWQPAFCWNQYWRFHCRTHSPFSTCSRYTSELTDPSNYTSRSIFPSTIPTLHGQHIGSVDSLSFGFQTISFCITICLVLVEKQNIYRRDTLLDNLSTYAKYGLYTPSILVVSAKFARWLHNLIDVHPQHTWYVLQIYLQKHSSLSVPLVLWMLFFLLPAGIGLKCGLWSILRNDRILGTHISCLGENLKMINVACFWLNGDHLLTWHVRCGNVVKNLKLWNYEKHF